MMGPLRILHVSASDKVGGAARAAHRIHLAQRLAGLDSHMLVLQRSEPAPYVDVPLGRSAQRAQRLKLAMAGHILSWQKTPSNRVLHSLNFFSNGLGDWINRSNFDVVNLHWVGSEMLSVEEIGRIRRPLFWTMHDMWPFCGSEHYDDLEYPGRYQRGYTPETRPDGYDGLDLDAWVWRRKLKAWADKRFHLISPSSWLAQCASQSVLMGQQPCAVIPNCVDADVFKPIDRRVARHILNLDSEKRYILFGAMAGTTDIRKGFHLFQMALQHLAQLPDIRKNTEILVFGGSTPNGGIDFGLPIHYMGGFHDDVALALLYSAADVFAAPSMQDNLPNTIVEALSCGTPCVGFDIGGMPDLIEHQHNGWLAKPFDSHDLASGLQHVLRTSSGSQGSLLRDQLFSQGQVANRYLKLYRESQDEFGS